NGLAGSSQSTSAQDSKPRLSAHAAHEFARIPTGFYHSAQGCEERATLGCRIKDFLNPETVGSILPRKRRPVDPTLSGLKEQSVATTQRSSFLANPGLNDFNPFRIGPVLKLFTHILTAGSNGRTAPQHLNSALS